MPRRAAAGRAAGPRLLLLVPTLRGGGNAVSARRLAAALAAEGARPRLLAVEGTGFPARLGRALASHRPGVVLAFHARKAGAAYLRHRVEGDPPLAVVLTGTEIHRDLADPARGAEAAAALEAAAAVISHGRALRDAAAAALPALRGRIRVVPKGVVLPPGAGRAAPVSRGDGPVFFLPAGLREVKDPLFALEPLRRLRASGVPVRFVHAGEALDPGLAAALEAAARAEPWIRTEGAVPFARVGRLYARAAVVLNTSRAEGLSNAVAEAMAAGRAVLASDIPANRELVRHGRTGLLYRAGDAASFLRAARRLATDAALRRRLGAAARAEAARRFSARAEARGVLEALEGVLAAPPAPTPAPAGAARPRRRG